MSDIVNRALADLLAGQHRTNQTIETMGRSVQKLAKQGEAQVVLIQGLINAMEQQSLNSVPLRQKVAELEERLSEVERKVS